MSFKNRWSRLSAATFLTVACGLPFAAQAQTAATPPAEEASSDGVGDIVVTAQKRSERLQDVPIAVTAISGESLTSKGITSTLDIQQATPGLTFTTVIGTASPRIRGIGTGSAIAGNENSVATYVDGVYYASSAGSVMQLASVAQVAVLKGPQGTLFGRNATGGLIQITTVDPKHDFGGRVTGSYGNKNTVGGSLYMTSGLTDAVAADLTVYYNNQMDGFGHNRFNGKEVGKGKDLALRSKWVADIGELTTIKVAGDYSTVEGPNPARRLITGAIPTIGTVFTGNPYDVNSNIQPYFNSKRGGVSGEVIHHFDAFDFSSLTAYRKTRTRIIFDTDATQVNNADTDNILRDRQFSQEFQLVSTGGGPLQWTAGAYYFWGKGAYDPAIVHRPPAVTTVFNAFQRTKSPAIYAQGSYKIAEATSLTIGARYSWETKRFDASGTNATGAGAPVFAGPLTGPTKLTAKKPTWRVALDHHLDTNVLIYASYNRGFKSGGFVPTVFNGPTQTFNPEILDAYEVGFKSDLLNRTVRLNGSGFYYDYKDIQITAYGTGPLPTIINAASAKIYGVDIDLTLRPARNLTFTGGFSYIHSRFGQFDGAQIAVPIVNAAGVRTGGNNTIKGSATGNKLPNTPDWTVDVGVDYDIPMGDGGLTLSGHYFQSAGWFAEPDNYLKQKAYGQLSGSVSWYMNPEKTFNVTAWGRNLTNEAVAVQMQARTTGDVLQIGQGRTYGLTLGYKF